MEAPKKERARKEMLYERNEDGDTFVFTEMPLDQFPPQVHTWMMSRHRIENDFRGGVQDESWTRTLKTSDTKITTHMASHMLRVKKGTTIELTYFIDTDRNTSTLVGEGILLKGSDITVDASDNPVPGWTENHKGSDGLKLGERRLAVMNAFSKQFYGVPLRSSPEINGMGRRLWEELETVGRARQLEEKDHYGFPRYEFVK